ncbi:MAG TPA: signal recognition particle protein [Gammaproteobacteria bacterium]|jgi:signal recognition particle subunit SRP54
MFGALTQRLSDAVRHLTGRGRITEDNVRDTVRAIRMALLEADVALPVAKSFIDRVRDRAIGDEVARSLNPGQAFTKIVHDELVRTLGEEPSAIVAQGRPTIVLLVGLQGAGKTTTAGKLARYLGRGAEGEVLLASTDVYRPAAREQLRRLALDLGVGFLATSEADPLRIAREAVAEAKRRSCRWLIIDTAGRLHVDAEMMAEIGAIQSAVAPAETLFVLDSMSGQDALNAARAFNEAVALTGVILTKTDGDARGGAALSVRAVTGVPIKLLGTGEKLDALEAFAPTRFAARILGMGDIVGLVEQVHARVDREAAERVAGKVKRGRSLDLNDFKEQLEQIAKLGGLESLLEKLPGIPVGAAQAAAFDARAMRRQIALIDSMTRRERARPELIDGSRKRRIAAGAGAAVQDVNRLLKQHTQLVKTMKHVAKRGGLRQTFGAPPRRPGLRGPR